MTASFHDGTAAEAYPIPWKCAVCTRGDRSEHQQSAKTQQEQPIVEPERFPLALRVRLDDVTENRRGAFGAGGLQEAHVLRTQYRAARVLNNQGDDSVDPTMTFGHDSGRNRWKGVWKTMLIWAGAFFLAGALAASDCSAAAPTYLDAQLVDAPVLARASTEGFFTVPLDGAGTLGTFQIGNVDAQSVQSSIALSKVEWSAGTLRSSPSIAVPLSRLLAATASGHPQSRIVMAGSWVDGAVLFPKLVAYCQEEHIPCQNRDFDMRDGLRAIAVADTGDRGAFDLFVGGNSKVRLESPFGLTLWEVTTGQVSALSYLPSTSTLGARVAVAGTTLQVRSSQTGALDAEFPLSAALNRPRMTAGKTADSDEVKLFVWSRQGGISAYGTEPARLLWSNPDIEVVAMTLARRDASVLQDLFVVDAQGQLRLLDGNGIPVDVGISVPNATHVASVSTGTTSHLLVTSSQNGRIVAVNRSSIGTVDSVWERYSGHFNLFTVSDLADDGRPMIVSLSQRPLSSEASESWLRLVDVDSGHEEWTSRFPPDAPEGGFDKIIEMTVGKNVGNDTSTIFLFSSLVQSGLQYVIEVDGATRTMRSRRPVSFGSGRYASKALPFTRDGKAKLAILSINGSAQATQMPKLHVVDVDNLEIEWTSAVMGSGSINSFIVDQPSAQETALAYFSDGTTGIYAFDLSTHLMLYSIPTSSGALALKRSEAGARLLLAHWSQSLMTFDAMTGAFINAYPFNGPVHGMVQDPLDPNRIVIAYKDQFCSYDYVAQRCEGRSGRVGKWSQWSLGFTGNLVAHVKDGESQFMAGNLFGIWRARLADDTLFRSGFDVEGTR